MPRVSLRDAIMANWATCGARGFSGPIGLPGGIPRLPEQDRPMPVLGPREPTAMDLRPDRITFVHDASGGIVRIQCV